MLGRQIYNLVTVAQMKLTGSSEATSRFGHTDPRPEPNIGVLWLHLLPEGCSLGTVTQMHDF